MTSRRPNSTSSVPTAGRLEPSTAARLSGETAGDRLVTRVLGREIGLA